MANLNTTQIAQKILGPSQRIYHQDLTTHANQQRLKTDLRNLGDFVFIDSGVINSNPQHQYNPDGLFFSIERQPTAVSNLGIWAAVNLKNTAPMTEFMLTATFIEPERTPLGGNPTNGTFAASLLLNMSGDFTGATVQLRELPGQLPAARLNLPGSGANPNRPYSNEYYEDVVDNDLPYTIILYVNRFLAVSSGRAFFYIEDKKADEIDFVYANGLTSGTTIDYFMAGLGTASGTYKCSVKLIEFEIFVPTPGQ